MTAPELSDDALRVLRNRRSATASGSPAVPESVDQAALPREQDAAKLRAFSAWFGRERSEGNIVMSGENMLDVGPALSRRFTIGMHDMRYFIGIPQDVKEWFSAMPWLHVALPRGSAALSLVCERVRYPGASMPEFALTFEVAAAALIKMLSNYHFIDVREIVPSSKEDQAAGVVYIGRDVLMTLDIRVVDGGQTFLTLLDGRTADGLQRRTAGRGCERTSSESGSWPRGWPQEVGGTFRGGIQQQGRESR